MQSTIFGSLHARTSCCTQPLTAVSPWRLYACGCPFAQSKSAPAHKRSTTTVGFKSGWDVMAKDIRGREEYTPTQRMLFVF